VVTAIDAARHCCLEPARFRDLVAKGTIKRMPPKAYKLDAVRESYIRYLQKVAGGRATEGDTSLSRQRARLATAQARLAESKANREEKKTVDVETAVNLFGEACSVAREILLALPGKASDSLTPFTARDRAAIHVILHREVCEALVNLRNPESFVRPTKGTDADGTETAP
jgi:hypothetical protein